MSRRFKYLIPCEGNTIKERREKLGLKPEELANKARIPVSTIYKIESEYSYWCSFQTSFSLARSLEGFHLLFEFSNLFPVISIEEAQILLEKWNGDINFYISSRIPGTAITYFEPISREIFLEDDKVEDRSEEQVSAVLELLESLREKAHACRANAVVGLDVTLNPFAEHADTKAKGLCLRAVGIPAKLEPPF